MPATPKDRTQDLQNVTDLPDDAILTEKGSKKDSDKNTGKDKGSNKDKNSDKQKKKKGFPLVPVLVLLVIIGAIVAVLAFNLFNVREQYIMPYLRNAPLVGGLLPSASPSPEGEAGYSDPEMTPEEMLNEITQLNYQIQKLEADLKAATAQNEQDADTIRILREYEAQWDIYRQIKAEFDAMIVRGDVNGYAQFFEAISPENAEDLYAQAVAQVQFNADEKRNASIYANMSPDTAAAGLQQLLMTDSALVVRILRNMDTQQVADIYNEMTTANLAVVSRLMAPTPAPDIVARTAPPLPTFVPVSDEGAAAEAEDAANAENIANAEDAEETANDENGENAANAENAGGIPETDENEEAPPPVELP